MINVTKEEFEVYREFLINELSAFLKECSICKQKFRDTLDKRLICKSCDRDQKIDSILK